MVALHIREKRSFQRGIDELVHAQRPEQGIRTHARDQFWAPAEQSRLRAAQQFVAAVSDDIDAGAQTVKHSHLAADSERLQIHQRAAAQILHKRQAMFPGHRDQFGRGSLFRESGNLEIRAVHPQNESRVLVDALLVIGNPRTVRCAHLAQNRSRLRHHVRNAKRSTNLHQFAARDHHLRTLSQRVQRQQNRRRIVIHDDGRNIGSRRDSRLGCPAGAKPGGSSQTHAAIPKQFAKQPIHVNVAFAALAGTKLKFQIRISRRSIADVGNGRFWQRRAP